MKILVTGATGFIGGYVIREALSRGHQVVAVVRELSDDRWSGTSGLDVLKWDLSENGGTQLCGMGIDTVIHLAAALSGSAEEQYLATVKSTENLMNAMREAMIHRLVGISSIAVLDYEAEPALALIDESVGTCRDSTRMGLYASLKLKQEELYTSFGTEPGNWCVILRPGLVYNEDQLISAHAGIIKGSLRLLVTHNGEVPTVGVECTARAILDAVEKNIANGEIFHLVDNHLPTLSAYQSGLRKRGLLTEEGLVLPWKSLAVLVSLLRCLFQVAGLRRKLPEALKPHSFAARSKPFRYSNDKAVRLLDWTPGNKFS